RRRHTRSKRDWSSDVCSSDLLVAQVDAPAKVEATLDRRQAVAGADYVIYAVQVGMHEATVKDFEIPKKYGLRQTIADTLGVGGRSEERRVGKECRCGGARYRV